MKKVNIRIIDNGFILTDLAKDANKESNQHLFTTLSDLLLFLTQYFINNKFNICELYPKDIRGGEGGRSCQITKSNGGYLVSCYDFILLCGEKTEKIINNFSELCQFLFERYWPYGEKYEIRSIKFE